MLFHVSNLIKNFNPIESSPQLNLVYRNLWIAVPPKCSSFFRRGQTNVRKRYVKMGGGVQAYGGYIYPQITVVIQNSCSIDYPVSYQLLIASRCFLNPDIFTSTLPPPSLISNIHSMQLPHTLSPLNDCGSHGSTLCPSSIMMATMDPHSVILNYYGSQ